MLYKDQILQGMNEAVVTTKLATFKVSTTLTRPNDTITYTAKDALTNALSSASPLVFENIGQSNGQVVTLNEVLITSSAKQSILPQLNLWLFNSIPTAPNDNDPFSITDAENNNVEAIIPLYQAFDTSNTSSTITNCRLEAANLNRQLHLKQNQTILWGLIQVVNSYAPVAEEVFGITLKGYRM